MYYLLAFVCGFLLGALTMALCAIAKRADEMAKLAREERVAMERMESLS